MDVNKQNVLQILLVLLGLFYTAPFANFLKRYAGECYPTWEWTQKNLIIAVVMGFIIVGIVVYIIAVVELYTPIPREPMAERLFSFTALWIISSIFVSIAYNKALSQISFVEFVALAIPYVPFLVFTTFSKELIHDFIYEGIE